MATEIPDDGDISGEYGTLVQAIQRGRRNQVRISLSEYKGREYIDIRNFYVGREDGAQYRPTSRGVTLPTEAYGELLKGVIELGATLGLVDPETLPDLDIRSGDTGQ